MDIKFWISIQNRTGFGLCFIESMVYSIIVFYGFELSRRPDLHRETFLVIVAGYSGI